MKPLNTTHNQHVCLVSLSSPGLPLVVIDEWLRFALVQPNPLVDLEALSSLIDAVYSKVGFRKELLGPKQIQILFT